VEKRLCFALRKVLKTKSVTYARTLTITIPSRDILDTLKTHFMNILIAFAEV